MPDFKIFKLRSPVQFIVAGKAMEDMSLEELDELEDEEEERILERYRLA